MEVPMTNGMNKKVIGRQQITLLQLGY